MTDTNLPKYWKHSLSTLPISRERIRIRNGIINNGILVLYYHRQLFTAFVCVPAYLYCIDVCPSLSRCTDNTTVQSRPRYTDINTVQTQQELSMIVKNQYTLISYSISIPYAFSIFVYLITVATISQNFRFFSRRVNREIVRTMVEAYSAIWRTSAGLSARDIECSKNVVHSIQQCAYARMSLGVTDLVFS